ncbi:MAG TPA: YdcF family protein [Paracoccaceae bacterium]|nr:YdcF family protein [Paracoccaceae bacterium]
MIRGLLRLLAGGVGLIAVTLLAVAGHALWLAHAAPPPAPAGAIVVLGGTMEEDGSLGRETARRAEKAVELYQAGLAPRIHFTGGIEIGEIRGAGDLMREFALARGVPPEASSAENFSRSTLQNALMSRPILGELADGPVILVSDGYHLGRSWLSFRWAGYGRPIGLAAATAFGDAPPADQALRLVREAAAWWFNLSRIGLWHVLDRAGMAESTRIALLQ